MNTNHIKSFILPLCMILFTGLSVESVHAQNADVTNGNQTIVMKVKGVCGECKTRIESAAMDVKGVKKAEWDIKTDKLVLVGSTKMKKEKVSAALAKAGYGSDEVKADPKAYANLPACCQYNDVEKH